MKTLLLPITACLFGASMLASCGTAAGDATTKTDEQLNENKHEITAAKEEGKEAWLEERAEAAKELRDLRETLVDQLDRQTTRLKDGIKDSDKKAACTARINELNTNIARIDASLRKVDATMGSDWDRVKADARLTVDETQNWFQRQTEFIDKKTDADNDHDGH